MPNPDSVLENETEKFLWYFEIQTDNLILAKRLDREIFKKKELDEYRAFPFWQSS